MSLISAGEGSLDGNTGPLRAIGRVAAAAAVLTALIVVGDLVPPLAPACDRSLFEGEASRILFELSVGAE
jgi:hypothetical protein